MKYLKTYEGIWSKNLKIGSIYLIDECIVTEEEYKKNIPLGMIVNLVKVDDTIIQIDMKSYIYKTNDEYLFEDFSKKLIKRLATPEEIEQFKEYEILNKANKYNL